MEPLVPLERSPLKGIKVNEHVFRGVVALRCVFLYALFALVLQLLDYGIDCPAWVFLRLLCKTPGTLVLPGEPQLMRLLAVVYHVAAIAEMPLDLLHASVESEVFVFAAAHRRSLVRHGFLLYFLTANQE